MATVMVVLLGILWLADKYMETSGKTILPSEMWRRLRQGGGTRGGSLRTDP